MKEEIDFSKKYKSYVTYENRRKEGKGKDVSKKGKNPRGNKPQIHEKKVIELRDIRKEVGMLGAMGFGKKEAKQWKRKQLPLLA